jgi:hypothetical protein
MHSENVKLPVSPCEPSSPEHTHDRKSLLGKSFGKVLVLLKIGFQLHPYDHPLLYGILSEFRTCLLRIRFLYANKLYLPSPSFGHAAEMSPTGHLVSCKETYDRIRDSKVFEKKFPGVTRVDWAMFLEAWDMGAKSCENRQHTQQTDSQASNPQAPLDIDIDYWADYWKAVREAEEILSRPGAKSMSPSYYHVSPNASWGDGWGKYSG